MTKHLVVVAGNIGVGKTSLTERIGARLGWWTGYESVADNPYLADFYSDMHAWAFHLQIFFLGHRADQYMVAARDQRSAILDRSRPAKSNWAMEVTRPWDFSINQLTDPTPAVQDARKLGVGWSTAETRRCPAHATVFLRKPTRQSTSA